MGSALAERLSHEQEIHLYNPHIEKAKKLQDQGFGFAHSTLKDAIEGASVVFLATKPQSLVEVVKSLKDLLKPGQILISLLAGTPIARLKEFFAQTQVIRMMPNLAISCGEGLIALSLEPTLKDQSIVDEITKLAKPLGKVYWLEEKMIDAFTSLAGSGPAFFYAIIEAMIEAGMGMGFSPKDSRELVYQMIKGSMHLLENSNKEPEVLKKQITSPGGTTLAGLQKFEENGVRDGILSTFYAAHKRAKELSQ